MFLKHTRRLPLKRVLNFLPQYLPLHQLSDVALPVLTLYTKDPCPLCDEAINVISPALHKVELVKVDITLAENKPWWDLYKYDIPVFHLNGEFLMKHKGDLLLLQDALRKHNITT